jgi:Protein of unknown function (DUF2490)
MKKIMLLVAILSLNTSKSAFAQKHIDDQNNAWYMYFGNHKINDRWGLHTEYQWRRHDWGQTWQQSLGRIGVDFQTKQGLTLTAGYGWIVSYPYGKQPIAYSFNEHRIWQQLTLKQDVGRISFNHRYRTEQRFLEQKTYDSTANNFLKTNYNFKQRARYRFMVTVPINHSKMQDKTVFFSAYDEVFLGFGKGVAKNIMEQNRIYLGVGYRFNKNVNVQTGYMNQFIQKADGVHAENNHNFQLSLTYNLDFSKKS